MIQSKFLQGVIEALNEHKGKITSDEDGRGNEYLSCKIPVHEGRVIEVRIAEETLTFLAGEASKEVLMLLDRVASDER